MRRKHISKLFFYIIYAVIPFALWVLCPGKVLVFDGIYSSLLTLGKMAGIIGISFFSGNLILSGRYHQLDWCFEGLDQLFLFHRRTGIYTFTLLSFHVFAISFQALQFSFSFFFSSIFDLSNMHINYGRIAYLGLFIIIILTLTLSGKIKYEYLKKMHQLLGIFLFSGGLHAFFIPSDISENIYLRYYVLTLIFIAIVSYLWRTVFRHWLIAFIRCEVIEIKIHGNVTEIVMRPQNRKKIAFYPGQFIFIKFIQENFPREDHPFSITASPAEGLLRISAKQLGDFTKILPQIKPGTIAKIQGPFGGFSYLHSHNKRQIWIAGGIGVTPFVSMARSIRDNNDSAMKNYDITMIYSVQTVNDFVYKDELEKIASQDIGFKFIPWIVAEKNFFSVQALKQITDIENKSIFLCGPKPMMFSLKKQLLENGIQNKNIHFELFRLL